MQRNKLPCKNHPEKQSAKRCYVCKDYICSECQHRWSHHLFCGYYCYFQYQILGYVDFLKLNLKLILLFLFIQFFTILLVIQLISESFESSKSLIEETKDFILPADSNIYFTIDTISSVNKNVMIFLGNSSSNSMLGLWHNGIIIQSVITKDTNYIFKPVPLFFGKNSFKVVKIDSIGNKTLIDSILINYSSSRMRYLMKSVSKVKTNRSVFSLTFDAGSITTGADSILQILKENQIQTTFFLTGKFISTNLELTHKIVDAGHEICNHSFSHPHLTQYRSNQVQKSLAGVNRDYIQQELLKTDSVFYANFNRRMVKLWRAPFGEYNNKILQWAAEIGYKHVRWSKNGDLADWVKDKDSGIYKTNQEMFEQIIKMHENNMLQGSIILMHLGTDRTEDYPYKMLPKLIKYLDKISFKIIKVSDLLSLQIST